MFSIIVAYSKKSVIGKDNSIPWSIPDDLKRFKELTIRKTIVMGRKTFESLPGILPGRKHIVFTNNKEYKVSDPNVEIVYDISKFIEENQSSNEEIFIIGGGEIYKIFYPVSNKLYTTEISIDIDGDTIFPKVVLSDWHLDYESDVKDYNGIEYIYKVHSK